MVYYRPFNQNTMSKLEANSKKRIGLGRGLGALLDDSEQVQGKGIHASDFAGSLDTVNLMEEISLDFIETNPFQPREHFEQDALQDLAESIRMHGIIQPITVRKIAPRKFQLISGERRLQASKLAGLRQIPAYVRTADDQQMIEMALIENIQRENLNAIEIALSYKRLMDECQLKQEDLGSRVGKNRSTVTNYMRLLKLPAHIQIAIRDNRLSMGHARSLVSLENAEVQNNLFQKAISEEWSVRKLEDAVRQSAHQHEERPSGQANAALNVAEIQALQSQLSSMFPLPVHLKISEEGKGELKFTFKSKDELIQFIEKVQK
jgi:ParB family transcriptional regulator, chromosome partitioning protein